MNNGDARLDLNQTLETHGAEEGEEMNVLPQKG